MIVSEARRQANRENALKSTGPKTPEGKERSRVNALKHGLCSSVIVHEDAQLVTRRVDQFFRTLRPQNDLHCWLVTEVALNSIKIDRADRMERRVRDKIVIKAELTWDDDRRLEAMLLGKTLGNQPDIVVEQLRKTVQGCEWLMTRWAMLKHVADVDRKWTPEQTTLAFDLLGTPHEIRVGRKPGSVIDFDGNPLESGDDPSAVAARQLEELKERREFVRTIDEVNRALAKADLGDDTDPELKRVRKYEGQIHSRLRWCLRELRIQSPFAEPLRGLQSRWIGDPEIVPPLEELKPPEPLPIPEIQPDPPVLTKFDHPPFDLEPHEYPAPGEVADLPKILANRRQEKLQKAENRRVAQRRKVEKLRA
jgi:hypothetical protein